MNPIQRGGWPGYSAADFNPLTGVLNTTVANRLKPWHVRTVVVWIHWSEVQPTAGTTQQEMADYIGLLLDQVDAHCIAAGRDPLPIFMRPYPSDIPDWINVTIPAVTGATANRLDVYGDGTLYAAHTLGTYTNAAGSGLHCVSFSRAQPATFGVNNPYPHDPVYQRFVMDWQDAINTGLEAADPDGTRVPLIHFLGPSMQSNTMANPTNLQEIFSRTGAPDKAWQTGAYVADPIDNAWTVTKHKEAFGAFATRFAGLSASQNRAWVFNFCVDDAIFNTDQIAVLNQLKLLHPAGQNAVIVKIENLHTFITHTFRKVYRANPGSSSPVAADWSVANTKPHGWEVWAPLTLISTPGVLAPKATAYLTPTADATPPITSPLDFTEMTGNVFNTIFPADWGGAPSGDGDPLWLELFGWDTDPVTLSTFPEWDAWAGSVTKRMRNRVGEVRLNANGTVRVATR